MIGTSTIYFVVIFVLLASVLAAVELTLRKEGYKDVDFVVYRYKSHFSLSVNKWMSTISPVLITAFLVFLFAEVNQLDIRGFSSVMLRTLPLVIVPALISIVLFHKVLWRNFSSFADFGISNSGLHYRPFLHWYLIPWDSVIGTRGIKRPISRFTAEYGIDVKDLSMLPKWQRWCLSHRRNNYLLRVTRGLANVQDLLEEIETNKIV